MGVWVCVCTCGRDTGNHDPATPRKQHLPLLKLASLLLPLKLPVKTQLHVCDHQTAKVCSWLVEKIEDGPALIFSLVFAALVYFIIFLEKLLNRIQHSKISVLILLSIPHV